MARAQRTNARTQRLTALVATVLLAAATGFAIGRVFIDHASTYRMVIAGILSAAIAVALERRSLLLATAISVAAMIAVVGFMVFPDTTWHGLPSLETLRAMVDAAGLVGEQARTEVAPTTPLAPLVLASLTATWAAIFSAHALAFRAGSPILALLPPIALVAFADTVLEEVIRPLYGVAFLIAATAMIFADGLRRVHGWGPVWTGPGREASLSIAAGRGARRVAAAAVAFAAVSPLLMPGFGSTAVLDFSTSGDDVRLNPLVSVGARLQRDDPLPAFDVTATTPSYWRMVALPDFDGSTWNPDVGAPTQEVSGSTPLTVNAAPDPSVVGSTVTASFTTTNDLDGPWLPMPYPASSTTLEAGDLRWDPETGALMLGDTVDAGTPYSVDAQLVRPTAEELRAEVRADPASVARYLEIPDGQSTKIEQLAREWTADVPDTTYDRAMALQQHFTSADLFTYDDSVDPRNDEDAMLRFLTVTRTGFCQQFASSMAIMLRTLNIPARVAVGFTAGEFDDDQGVFHVSTEQAHAWVEIYFPTYGWLTFDPTPRRADTVAYPYLDPNPSTQPCSRPQCASDGADARGTAGQDGSPVDTTILQLKETGTLPGALFRPAESGQTDLLAEPGGGVSPRAWLALGLLGIALVLAMIPPFRALERRRRLRRAAHEPRALILTTYDVFTERAAEIGFPRVPGQTVREYRDGLQAGVGLANDSPENADLLTLSALTTDAAYAPRDPDADAAHEAERVAASTMRTMRRKAGWVMRIIGPYRRA